MPNEHFQPALCAIEHRMAIEAKLKDKIEAVFLDSVVRKDAEAILDRYGIESHEQEPIRVKLAILKLAGQGPTLERLAQLTDTAKADFRDILSWAEYPRQSKNWLVIDAEKKQKMVQADLEEYQSWLNT